MNLVIDSGNTAIKLAVFDRDLLIEKFIYENINLRDFLVNILKKYTGVKSIIVCSVGKNFDEKIFDFINEENIYFISSTTKFPFQNLYKTPLTLGLDRMVLASGAIFNYPNQNRLVIDVGTCVTYDFINNKNQYLGGAISPGFSLRYKSLNDYTQKLPLLSLTNPIKLIGNSTEKAIHSGVVNGLTNEIDGIIDKYRQEHQNFVIILTGGDAEFLAKRLKNFIFASSNFLLESLNKLHHYLFNND